MKPGQMAFRLAIVVACIIALACVLLVGVKASVPRPPASEEPVTLQFFGMHIQDYKGNGWPTIPFGSWRDSIGWRNVEPQKGVWDFKNVDAEVDAATQHNVELLLDIGFTPLWASGAPDKQCRVGKGLCAEPANIQDWRDYIHTLGTRYKGRVKYYEIWNEPNDTNFYTGTIPGLVQMSKVAREVFKSIDPEIQVVSPVPTSPAGLTLLDSFFAAGGGSAVDIVGFHFYVAPSQPEGIFSYVQQLYQIMQKHGVGNKPIWDTENGWRLDKLDPDTQMAYLARTMLLERAAGASRVFWFSWGYCDEPQGMCFTEMDRRTPSAAARSLKVLEDWLIGSSVESCDSTDRPQPRGLSHALWVCRLVRQDRSDYVVWSPDTDREFSVPDNWGVRIDQVRYLSGESKELPNPRRTTVGKQPVLFTHGEP